MEPALTRPRLASRPGRSTLRLTTRTWHSALAAAALAAGTLGLGLSLTRDAPRLGTVTPRYVLLAGVIAALVARSNGTVRYI